MTVGGRCHWSVWRDGHIRTAATEAAETVTGRTASVVAAAPVGITTYDADGDRRRRFKNTSLSDHFLKVVTK